MTLENKEKHWMKHLTQFIEKGTGTFLLNSLCTRKLVIKGMNLGQEQEN